MNTLSRAVPFGLSRRQILSGSAAAGLLGVLPRRVWADAPDIKGASIRAAYYKGQELLSLTAAGLTDTPYKVAYSEFGSGNLIIQAINAGAIDVGGMSNSAGFRGDRRIGCRSQVDRRGARRRQ